MSAVGSPVAGVSALRRGLRQPMRTGSATTIALMVALAVTDALIQPGLLSLWQLGLMVQTTLTIALLGFAQTVVVLGKGLDLSVGGALVIGNTMAAVWLTQPFGWLGILLAGLAVGAVNGFLVVWLRIEPLVATLATWAIMKGLALVVLPSPGGEVPDGVFSTLTGNMLGLPMGFFLLAALLLAWLCIKRSSFGLALYAIGSDEDRAALSGVPVRRTRIMAYTVSGLLATLSGVYLAATTQGGDPALGDAYLLPCIAVVIIGGTSLAGGQGGVGLTVVGAISLTLLTDIVAGFDLPMSVSLAAASLLLLTVVGSRAAVDKVRSTR